MLKFFRLPFASAGDKTAVPDPVDVSGNVSYTQGYGFDYQRQKTDPAAKNIERDKMNQVLFDVTNAIAEIQAQGVPDFITTALNGGTPYSYAVNALVRWTDGNVYISLVAANTSDPTDATKWALAPTPARIQSAANTSAVAGGTADALTATFSPAITSLPVAPGTLSVLVRAASANTTTTPTFATSGTAAKTIVKGNNQPLVVGDIAGAGHWLDLQYDATLDKWILQNPATSITPPVVNQIQPVTATQGSGALTFGVNPTTLDFRNTTLTNGVPTTLKVGTLSLVLPSGGTLGAVSGVSARIALVVINNAGTPELAVVNIAGGNDLSETGVINTTAISASSTSANTFYSTTARTGVAYRVSGFADAVNTAGAWGNPTLVQGYGGQALAAMSSLGYGQTRQDVTGSRTNGTTYYNTTGKPIIAMIVGGDNVSQSWFAGITVNSVQIYSNIPSGLSPRVDSISQVILPGQSYAYYWNASARATIYEIR